MNGWKQLEWPLPLNRWCLISFGQMKAPQVAKLIYGGEDDGVWQGKECWWDGDDRYWSPSDIEEYMLIPSRRFAELNP